MVLFHLQWKAIDTMKIITTRHEMVKMVTDFRARHKTIGFIPTMGYLHQGHLSLVKRARAENDVIVVSIFVNPTQFGAQEDFASYPRDLEHDEKLLEGYADYIFYPSEKEVYGHGETQGKVYLNDITQCLCGISRPYHFQGVAAVVEKLFRIIRPHRAYFGQKDYQQTVVVRRLINDLHLDVELVVCPTVRESNGLAMSSRNVYLSPEERKQASVLYRSLTLACQMYQHEEQNPQLIIQKMKELIQTQTLAKIDYIDIRDAFTLDKKVDFSKNFVVALAVFFGKTRLIDNFVFRSSNYETQG